jgi:hypothetical protein
MRWSGTLLHKLVVAEARGGREGKMLYNVGHASLIILLEHRPTAVVYKTDFFRRRVVEIYEKSRLSFKDFYYKNCA